MGADYSHTVKVVMQRLSGFGPSGIWAGLIAGLGAVLVPRQVGLGDPPNADRRVTQLMTVAWYVIGGLVAAAAFAAEGASAEPAET